HKMNELKEQYFGQFEGEHIENIRLKYPEGDIPGVETFDSLAERTSKVIKYIEENHSEENILIIAHSRTIKTNLSLYTDEINLHKMNELKEQYFGQFEGEHIENIRLKYPEGDIPGVETFDSLAERTSKVIKYIEENHSEENILIIAHSRTIKSILSLYTDEIHMVFTKLDNCSLSIIESDGVGWKVLDYNISTLS